MAGPWNRQDREDGRWGGSQFRQQPDNRREAGRREAQYGWGERQSQQRLSPEERQQLRRDIRDAGREIYRGRR